MKIKNTVYGSTPVLQIEGSLSAEMIFQFEREIDRYLEDPPDLVIDFTKVTFIDSAALGSFLKYVSLFRKRSRHLLISGVSSQILEVFKLTGVTDQIMLYDTPQNAIEFLNEK
ncbi:MAG: STAS domain-containing protein [Spirochaetes bacterium]|nr:STAS domain-containing protein [Spirochaetota bacterium]